MLVVERAWDRSPSGSAVTNLQRHAVIVQRLGGVLGVLRGPGVDRLGDSETVPAVSQNVPAASQTVSDMRPD